MRTGRIDETGRKEKKTVDARRARLLAKFKVALGADGSRQFLHRQERELCSCALQSGGYTKALVFLSMIIPSIYTAFWGRQKKNANDAHLRRGANAHGEMTRLPDVRTGRHSPREGRRRPAGGLLESGLLVYSAGGPSAVY